MLDTLQPAVIDALAKSKTILPQNVRIRGALSEYVDANFSLFGDAAFESWQPKRTRLFLVIVTSQSARATKQRHLVRTTWLKHIKTKMKATDIDAKFFIGRYSKDTIVLPAVKKEMDRFNDIVVVDVGDAYGGLIEKVRAAFQW